MRTFEDFLEGVQRDIRLKTASGRQDPDIANNFSSNKELQGMLQQASLRAQELNRSHPQGISIRHAISATHSFEKVIQFLTSKSNQEISVSVKKQEYGQGYAISMQGLGRLRYYFPTDSLTGRMKSNPKFLIPTLSNTWNTEWDEGVVRLRDVVWQTCTGNVNTLQQQFNVDQNMAMSILQKYNVKFIQK